jgi:hypothetical protein
MIGAVWLNDKAVDGRRLRFVRRQSHASIHFAKSSYRNYKALRASQFSARMPEDGHISGGLTR